MTVQISYKSTSKITVYSDVDDALLIPSSGNTPYRFLKLSFEDEVRFVPLSDEIECIIVRTKKIPRPNPGLN